MFNKKGISPVVAITLLLIITVLAVVGFQGWYETYSSKIFSDTEIRSDSASSNKLSIEKIVGNNLYVLNDIIEGYNVTELKIDGFICNNLSNSLTLGINIINISDCLSNISTATPDVVLFSENSILQKKFFIKDVSLSNGVSSGGGSGSSGTWISYLDDTKWVCLSNCNGWDGTQWEESGPGMALEVHPLATWEEGFRPTKVRVTFTDATELVPLGVGLLGGGIDFGTCSNYITSTECDINVISDIERINLYSNTMNVKVQNIEFYTDVPIVIPPGPIIPPSILGSFISTWDTTLDGDSNSNQISLPLENDGIYNFTVNWGDGTNSIITQWDQAEVTHTYASSGQYVVNITGTIVGFKFDWGGDYGKIIDINKWGSLGLGNNQGYFAGCENLDISATDAPYLEGTTDLSYMFANTYSLNSNINHWDVSSVTNMYGMFSNAFVFNQPLNNWDVSSVTDMGYMFSYATLFNQNISGWDVSSVIDMSRMFANTNFNNDISGWNTESVEYMIGMFSDIVLFNQDISGWDVSSVIDMSEMFNNADSFNQDISGWNVSSVIDMGSMFDNADSFNQDISGWDVSSVEDMGWLFSYTSFNQDISGWDVSNVQNIQGIFYHNSNFNQDIGIWNTSSVTNMGSMFQSATNFNQDISGWDTSKVTDMINMFANTHFSYDISGWDVGKVEDMSAMFYQNNVFNQPIVSWNTSSLVYLSGMFYGASSFNQDISGWDTSKVLYMGDLFRSATAFNQDISSWCVSLIGPPKPSGFDTSSGFAGQTAKQPQWGTCP